jgi:glycosyltransferase involved in cell wall biosynthesis
MSGPPERIKVLMVAPFPKDPEKVVGGTQAATAAIATTLCEDPRIEQIVIADLHHGEAWEPKFVHPKLQVERIRLPFQTGETLMRHSIAIHQVRKLAAKVRPHLAHGQGLDRAGMVATHLGLPSVVTVHGLINVEARMRATTLRAKLQVPLVDSMVRSVLKAADVVISISDYDAKALGHLVRGATMSIPNAVPGVFFEQEPSARDEPEILFAGVMRDRKNVLGLVQAFAVVRQSMPSARLSIAGPAPWPDYQREVVERVRQLNLEDAVTFLGHVTTEQLIAAMRRARVLTLFSFEETLPTVIAQAMAVGCPVVASNVGGIPGMIDEGKTGYLVQSGDEAALARRLLEVLSQPELAKDMGIRAASLARDRYFPTNVAARTIEAYDTAIAAHLV